MAAMVVEQPLKKRKVHESIAVVDFQQQQQQPLTQDEILRKQRNKADIRSLYEQYTRIKFCVSKNDVRLMPDFELAYLALITASRGCTSAQRIVAELIPRYASHCPTALEAAAKVAINMYNWNFAAIVRGDDFDGIAFEIAQACIFGLVDICSAASSEASTSSVIQGICSTVFLNVLTFFVSSFEGKDFYQIANEDTQKVQGSPELFLVMKERVLDGGESGLSKLFKFRALSLLRIFFCCPKNLLEACFELVKSTATDTVSFGGGNYFMRQVTSEFPYFDGTSVHKTMSMSTSCIGPAEPNTEGFEMKDKRVASDANKASGDESLSYNCLLGMALKKDPSLRHWILLKYKKFCKTASPQAVSDISSSLDRIFKSFALLVEEVDSQEDSDVDNSDPSKYISRQYSIPRVHENLNESADKDRTPRRPNVHCVDSFNHGKDFGDKFSGQLRKPSELDMWSVNENMNHESVKKLESGNHGESFREHMNSNNFLSPVNRKPFHLKSDEIEGGNHFTRAEKNQMESDFSSPAMRRSNSIGTSDVLESPEQHSSSVRHRSSNQTVWYFDGDSASMDVYSASKQLWVGSLSPDASETGVRFQVEKFGSIEQFLFFPIKGFALVEYTNIMDAIKARESMRRSSPWGGHLQVKFLDVGLGSRGSINGVAVGLSCYVYVGNVSSQWLKDEILHEVTRVGARTLLVADLTSENALLLEFDTADEATVVMAHLRKYRKENGYNLPLNRSFSSKEGITDGGRHTPIGVGLRSMPNNTHGSPHTPTVYDSAAENLKMRMSQLSSLMLSLSSKYNIPRNYHANVAKDEDRVPTNTLLIGLPHLSSTFITDDEVKTVSSHAVGNIGSVVRLTRENMQMSSRWFVELSSIDAAVIALKNLLSCPGMFFHVEFSQPGSHGTQFGNRSESSNRELISPKLDLEKPGNAGNTFQMNWNRAPIPEASSGNYSKIDGPPTNMAVNFSQASHSGSGQMWTYLPPTPNQASSYMRPPVYTGWDGHTQSHPLPPMHIAPHMIMPNPPTPFMPPSVTPLPHHLSGPPLPAISPPPLPISQPPLVPPPPTSPPLDQSQWQGMLSKSGVNYCSIYARREETDTCKYSNAPNEPRGWPVRLDVTKRTDFQHVKSTFASTPSHRREVCRLLPSSSGDHKGFQDFITYLKQRECAGVIKIPGEKLIWPRLLFILPQLPDICSMVGVTPNPLECLIALVVPKEPTSEWVA